MSQTKLKPTSNPDPKTRTIFEAKSGTKGPILVGHGADDYTCPNCGEVLAKGMQPGQINNIVFHCPNCGDYSEV